MAANLIDGLIEYDKYGVVQPSLAKEWSSNDDATVWTFKLRDDAKWVTHDGKEYADVVAQDFVDGLHYVLDAKRIINSLDCDSRKMEKPSITVIWQIFRRLA